MGSRALLFGGAWSMSLLLRFDHFDQEALCRGMILYATSGGGADAHYVVL